MVRPCVAYTSRFFRCVRLSACVTSVFPLPYTSTRRADWRRPLAYGACDFPKGRILAVGSTQRSISRIEASCLKQKLQLDHGQPPGSLTKLRLT